MKKNKALTITSAKIEVGTNQFSECGYLASWKIRGILPGCRKSVQLTHMYGYGKVILTPLFGYNGRAVISQQDWKNLMEMMPIVSDKLFPIPITPELKATVRRQMVESANCPAITSSEYVHPDYQPGPFDSIVFEKEAA